MLPGKKYTLDDFLGIAARRSWIVVVFVAVCATAAVLISKRLPNQFRSETLIMPMPQRIPDSYVKSAVTGKIEDRLNALEDQILSRSRLERIILDLNLYQGLRRRVPMEDVVQRMRDDITFKTEGKESFRLTFVSDEAKTAQKTTERLANLFIEESTRDRENLAEDTSQFLGAQLEDAKRQLKEHETKLEEYRTRYGGELPSQVSANLQAVQNLQVQLQNLAEATDRARERRLLLERQVVDLQADETVVAAPVTAAASATTNGPESTVSSGSIADQLQLARARLQNLLVYDKPDHPDVRNLQRTIKQLEAKLQAEKPAATEDRDGKNPTTAPPAADRVVSQVERLRQQRLKDARLQIEDVDRQLAEKQALETRLRALVADYQGKLDAVPKRESDLIELTRDYATLQGTYQSLLAKQGEAKLAANLERRNIGEQFRVLDPARVPERPFSPNRIQIDLGGGAAGLLIGLLLVGWLEYRDTTFTCEEDVVGALNIRVLALIPAIGSDTERRTRRWRLAGIGAAVVAVVVSGAALILWRRF